MGVSSSLISFKFSHLLIIFWALGKNESEAKCDESFECGSLGEMSFPFSKSTDPDCGLCVVNCKAEPPRIKLTSEEVWYDTIGPRNSSTIRIRAPSLNQQGCFDFNNLNLPRTGSISVTIFPNITLFKCFGVQLGLDAHFRGYNKFNQCEHDHNFTVYYNYRDGGRDHSAALVTVPEVCSTINMPVLPSGPPADPNNLFNSLATDFFLKWHVSDDCYGCHRRGGKCLTDSVNGFYCSLGINGSVPPSPNGSNWKTHKLGLILGTVVLAGGVIILIILGFKNRKKFSSFGFKIDKYQNVEAFLKNYDSLAPKRYTYFDVKKMTSSFKISLGQGGYGSVFKGKLQNGSLVAIKILDESKGNGEEFINEVASISRTSHVNIVKLLGFCFEHNKRALIYEFMPNGSLEKFIYQKELLVGCQLGWQTLYKIAIGIARGLEYLHCRCNTQILHFDIKPHNILLDEDFSPKISDFGLSKLCTRTKSIVSILGARGTIGYIAPEVVCRTFGVVSHKSDVYSYGMMILEMVGKRKNVVVEVDHTSEIYYPHWIYKHLKLNEEIIHDGSLNEEDNENARKMIIVSLWCIQANPSSRPSMTKVVEMLEGNLESLEVPPKPFLYSPSQTSTELSNIQIT